MGNTVSLKEAAEYLGVHYQTAKKYVKDGSLAVCAGRDGRKNNRGSTYQISMQDLEEFKRKYIETHGDGHGRGRKLAQRFAEEKKKPSEVVAIKPAFVDSDLPDITDRAGNFKRLLMVYNVSWDEYAKALCLSRGDILAKCNGKAPITKRDIYKLCAVLEKKHRDSTAEPVSIYNAIRTGTFDPKKVGYILHPKGGASAPESTSENVTSSDIGIKPTLEVTYYYTVIKCKEAEDFTTHKLDSFITAPYIFTSRTAALEWIKKDAMEKHKCLDLDPHETDKDAFYAYYVNKTMFRAERAVYYVRRVDNGIYVSSAESRT